MKLWVCIFIFFGVPAAWSLTAGKLRSSSLVPPGRLEFSAAAVSQARYIFKTAKGVEAKKAEPWLMADVFGFWELSPFEYTELNAGFEVSAGSSGLVFYTSGRWVPFPDYGLQPSIGLFVDVFAGIPSQKNTASIFFAGAEICLLIMKELSAENSSWIDYWSPYLAPSIHTYFSTLEWAWDIALGIKLDIHKSLHFPYNLDVHLGGRYGRLSHSIDTKIIFYL